MADRSYRSVSNPFMEDAASVRVREGTAILVVEGAKKE